MDFALSEEQTAIFDMAYGFGQEHVAPNAMAWEAEGTIPKELWTEIGQLGLGGIYVSEETGGSGLSRLDATLVFEALSMACPAVAAFLSIHNMCAWMIDTWGSEEQRQRFLPSMMTMEKIASYCLTEPGAGSDAASLRTKAVRDGDHYVLNGAKAFISGAGTSDYYIVMCRTGGDGPKGISTIVVEKDTPGLSFGANEKKMGWNAQPTRVVNFEDCRVPAANLLAEEGMGFTLAMNGLNGGRINIGACSLGGASEAFDVAKAYVGTRKQFGREIGQFQVSQFKLADMATELEASRLMLYRAAAALDAKDPSAAKYCAMAKRFATDQCFDIANQALQLHGGYGYLKDYPLERIVRDLRVHQILEGTNEIMRVIIAKDVMR